jgi:hypothetical protein
VKVEKPIREMLAGEMTPREFYAGFGRALTAPAPAGRHFALDLLDVMRTAVYVIVSVPAYALASVVFAAAIYVRLAGALLMK